MSDIPKKEPSYPVPDALLKPYNPAEVEDRLYAEWEKSGYFNPDICEQKGVIDPTLPYFSIVLPPPNVTGVLHMGSAFMLAIEDAMVRFARMQGRKTLWIPGTDHAAIATQAKVEKLISKEEKKNRHDLGREEFLKRVEQFAKESHDVIVKQIRKTGCSIDWSREAFTLDEKRSLAVKTAFKRMYDDGIIYRGYRIVNWDPKGQTTISDDEIVYQTEKTKLYTFRYAKDFPIAIATTRPETKIGDTAVAVHPDDARYKKYVGKEYDIDFAGVHLHIKIVADSAVNPEFGTGAVGVTPAHSMTDWDIAQRHHLPLVPIIDERARMMESAGSLHGKKVAEVRISVVEWLAKETLIEKEEEIEHNIATAERTGGIIEPMPRLQWFVNVNAKFKNQSEKLAGIKKGEEVTLKELMLAVVKNGQTKILPDRFEKVYFHWIENLRDWCISRQIWYGHQIPVWYKENKMHCDISAPKEDGWVQDEDTLDTWFSSGLWTFSTLGWPEETADLKQFHPTTILETGYDILFFWIARMILMSTYLLGDIPFKTVYLHGLVRDKDGNKISKSLGNNLDPLEIISQYGADAMRMSLLVGTGPGNDSRISNEKLKAYKHFANKIWNVARFLVGTTLSTDTDLALLEPADRETYNTFSEFKKDITSDFENYRLYLAAEKIYQYLWHTLADILIEEKKPILSGEDSPAKKSAQVLLQRIFTDSLKLLHPFMPFITEEIWSLIQSKDTVEKRLLMTERWPD